MTLTMLVIVTSFVTTTPDPSMSRLPVRAPLGRPGTTIEQPVANVGIGQCSTNFTVRDPAGRPIPAVTIHVRLRYGFMGLRRMSVDVATDTAGKARVVGLPEEASMLLYEISRGSARTQVHQDLTRVCRGGYDVALR